MKLEKHILKVMDFLKKNPKKVEKLTEKLVKFLEKKKKK